MTVTAAPLARTFKIGDEVVKDPDYWGREYIQTVYVIEKVPVGARGVNYVAKPKNGVGRGIRCSADGMLPAPQGVAPVAVSALPYVPVPVVGTLVKINGAAKIADGTLAVVLGEGKNGTAKIARLGGENGRYWTGMPMRYLTVVPMSDVIVG